MIEVFALAVAFGMTFLCGATLGKQWGRESVADADALQWRDAMVARAKLPEDNPRDWAAHIGPESVLRLVPSTEGN